MFERTNRYRERRSRHFLRGLIPLAIVSLGLHAPVEAELSLGSRDRGNPIGISACQPPNRGQWTKTPTRSVGVERPAVAPRPRAALGFPSKRHEGVLIAKGDTSAKTTDTEALFSAWTPTESRRPLWSLTEGLGAPAGVVYDPHARELYVSQISGEGDKKDGVGVVSRISPEGHVLMMEWISGLNAPKGLAISGDTLWVTDIDELVAINISAGTVRKKISIDGARFLTGIVADSKGVLYVGDMLTSRIYRVEHDRVRVFSEDRALESPGALLMCDDRLLVAGWGYTTDYTTAVPGSLFFLDLKSGKRSPLCSAPRANWFGLTREGPHAFLASDFGGGRIYRIDDKGRSTCVLRRPLGCAGIAYVPENKLLVLTETRENRIAAYVLLKPAKEK